MIFKTTSAIIADIITALGLVPGRSTQLYAEDKILLHLAQTYREAVSDRFWSHMMQWFSLTLDGTTGTPTEVMANVAAYSDIRAVFADATNRKLNRAPVELNRFTQLVSLGSTPLYIEPINLTDALYARLFRVLPYTATGTVRVHARVQPSNLFTNREVLVPFDADVLVNLAAYRVAANDGTNVSHLQSLMDAAQTRMSKIITEEQVFPIELDTREYIGNASWRGEDY